MKQIKQIKAKQTNYKDDSTGKKNFVFSKENFIILAISITVIIFGFWLMSGGKTTEETGFDPRIFDLRRIYISPIVTMIGFALVPVAILWKPKNKKEDNTLNK